MSLAAILAALRRVPAPVWYSLLTAACLWFAYSWIFHRGAASREQEVNLWRTAAQAATEANRANQKTIAGLREANAAWAATCTLDQNASGEAVSTVEANRDALPADDNRRQQERGRTYETEPSAAEWSRTRVPESVARRLRN